MKKITAIILGLIMCFTALGAGAASVPAFMKSPYNNCTADYKISLKIDNVDEIIAFLSELEMPDEIYNYIDVKALLESLGTIDSKMHIQAEVSDDFRRAKVALTGESNNKLVLNGNYSSSHQIKAGVWVDMNLDSRELVVVYSTPLNNKYAVLDFAKDVPAEVSGAVFDAYDKIYNTEFIKKTSDEVMAIVMKYADVSVSGSSYAIKYSNDSFTAVLDEVVGYSIKMVSEFLPELYDEYVYDMIPSFKGIKLLGEDGLNITYNLSGSKVKSIVEKIDISFNVSDIYTNLFGGVWEYEFDGSIDMTFESVTNISDIGTTHAVIPEITEQNSFSIADMFFDVYEEYEYEPYVDPYVWGMIETDTFDGVRYYMPLRDCIESMYYETATIGYDNGLVTIATDCKIEGKDINAKFSVGDNFAYVNGVLYENIGEFKLIDGKVFASVDFYEKCLGWKLTYLNKNLLEGTLTYDFYTSAYEE